MKNSNEELKERLRTLYPNEDLTDDDLKQITRYLVNFFTIGAKMTYSYKKRQGK